MFVIKPDKTICLTRGDVANIDVTATLEDGTSYYFKTTDVVRLKVCQKGDYSKVVLQKDATPVNDTASVTISLTRFDTRIGEVINAPVDYWYEIEVNPDTKPNTIIGHDESGPKIFRLFPEGGDGT